MSVVYAAGLIVYRRTPAKAIEYLLLQASYPPHHWTPPKGHLEKGETLQQAALRETKEEANIDASDVSIENGFLYVAKYIANNQPKEVHYWLARYTADHDIQLSNEHQKFQWNPLEASIKLGAYKETEDMLRKAEAFLLAK